MEQRGDRFKLGSAHASPFAFLLLLACPGGLLLIGPLLGLRWPRRAPCCALGTGRVARAYQIFYLLALDTHVTPGIMATVMGVQPILTVVLMERQRSISRLFGLGLGLSGLIMVVYQGLNLGGVAGGMLFALLALASMTWFDPAKRITDNPRARCRCSPGRLCPVRAVAPLATLTGSGPGFRGCLAVDGPGGFAAGHLVAVSADRQGNLVNVTSLSTWCRR